MKRNLSICYFGAFALLRETYKCMVAHLACLMNASSASDFCRLSFCAERLFFTSPLGKEHNILDFFLICLKTTIHVKKYTCTLNTIITFSITGNSDSLSLHFQLLYESMHAIRKSYIEINQLTGHWIKLHYRGFSLWNFFIFVIVR